MAEVNINIDNLDTITTVSKMRKHLAQMLAHLDGSQQVSYAFRAHLPFYRPVAVLPRISDPGVVYGELARPEND